MGRGFGAERGRRAACAQRGCREPAAEMARSDSSECSGSGLNPRAFGHLSLLTKRSDGKRGGSHSLGGGGEGTGYSHDQDRRFGKAHSDALNEHSTRVFKALFLKTPPPGMRNGGFTFGDCTKLVSTSSPYAVTSLGIYEAQSRSALSCWVFPGAVMTP